MAAGGGRLSVFEETRVPSENPRDRAGDDQTFPHTTSGIKPGFYW